ncbi:hypothetical protein F4814DRAFT_31774 [Daldinia grandis]|nr:hypothetical protein F4814DRAFT_31774 [Daldinia grandis]
MSSGFWVLGFGFWVLGFGFRDRPFLNCLDGWTLTCNSKDVVVNGRIDHGQSTEPSLLICFNITNTCDRRVIGISHYCPTNEERGHTSCIRSIGFLQFVTDHPLQRVRLLSPEVPQQLGACTYIDDDRRPICLARSSGPTDTRTSGLLQKIVAGSLVRKRSGTPRPRDRSRGRHIRPVDGWMDRWYVSRGGEEEEEEEAFR